MSNEKFTESKSYRLVTMIVSKTKDVGMWQMQGTETQPMFIILPASPLTLLGGYCSVRHIAAGTRDAKNERIMQGEIFYLGR